MTGFVKIHRSFFESEQWRTPTDAHAALWLIMHVAWKERWQKCGNVVERVERGQGFWSLRYLASAWGVTVKQARGVLGNFERTGFLRLEKGTHGTRVTVCNYSEYQDQGHTEGTDGAHGGHTEGTNKKKERRKEGDKGYTSEQAVADWNAMAERAELPKVQKISKQRQGTIRARLADCGGRDGWLAALAKVEASDYLCGRVNGWKADFDFVCRESKFIKLMEGGYDNRSSGRRPAPSGDPLGVAASYLARREDPGEPPHREGWPVRDGAADGAAGHDGGHSGDSVDGGRGLPTGPDWGDGEGSDPFGSHDCAPDGMVRGEVVSLH